MNFAVDYDDASGVQLSPGPPQLLMSSSTSSSVRNPAGGRTAWRPQCLAVRAVSSAATASTTTPRRRTSISRRWGSAPRVVGFTLATPYRDKLWRQRLAQARRDSRSAEITDGTSNTIMIGEDAGRDATFLSPYTEGYYNGDGVTPRPILGQGPAGGLAPYEHYWPWAEPDESFGVSGQPNNKFRPMHELERQSTGVTAGNNAGTTTSCSPTTLAA